MNEVCPPFDPGKVLAVILDIDGTLYDSPLYVDEQSRVQVDAWARERGVGYGTALSDINAFRAAYAKANGGKKTSIANAFAALGAGIEKSVGWREKFLDPEKYLSRDDALVLSLDAVSRFVKVCALTNNPRSIGKRTLCAVGIEEFVGFVVGLDDTMKSKPSREPFDMALSRLAVPASACLSVGDRFDVDIEIPLSMGMQGALVSGPVEVIAVLDRIIQVHRGQ